VCWILSFHIINILIGFCAQNINTTGRYFTADYEATPSYTDTIANLRCIEGYDLVTPGSAVCGSNGEWIVEYPDCRGTCYVLEMHACVLIHVYFIINT